MNLRFWKGGTEERQGNPLPFDEWVSYFGFDGLMYPLMGGSTPGEKQEPIGRDFRALTEHAFKQNGVVFACVVARMLLFSEARFKFRQLRKGRPGDLFGDPSLMPIERPAPGQNTGDLLSRALLDADLAGNWFGARRPGNRIRRLRPDWVTIVLGSPNEPDTVAGDIDAEVIGYIYEPGGPNSGNDPEVLLVGEVAHFAPIPDPAASFRGISWLTPIIREIMADKAATDHKLRVFEGGGQIPHIMVFDEKVSKEAFNTAIKMIEEKKADPGGLFKTVYLRAAAKPEIIGANLEQLEFKETQGAGETRIAAAAGIPPVIVGLSEGLAAATYSNYELAMRRFADLTMRPLWRGMAGALADIIKVPDGAELWYDDRDIPALATDLKKASETNQANAATIRQLVDAGFEPDSVVDAVNSDDFTRLVHSGLPSVQLQEKPSDQNGSGETPPKIVLPENAGE